MNLGIIKKITRNLIFLLREFHDYSSLGKIRNRLLPPAILLLSVFATSCNRPVGDDIPELLFMDVLFPPMYEVGGNVTGLGGENFVLQNANGETITLSCPAPCSTPISTDFVFPTTMHTEDAYDITIVEYPSNKSQMCVINQNSGVIGNSDVYNVSLSCEDAYRISGDVSGLTGSGLTLTNNGVDDLVVLPNSTSFTFHTPLYVTVDTNVAIASQPTNPWQTCDFAGSNTLTGTYSTGDLTLTTPLTCVTNSFDVYANISGLTYDGLVVNINGTPYTYNAGISITDIVSKLSGESYSLSITTPPPGQNCVMYGGGSGTIANADIVGQINCSTTNYSAGGSLSGLSGSGLSLEMTGTRNSDSTTYTKTVTENSGKTSYVMATDLQYGDTITSVSITSQPTSPDQYCSFSSGGTTYTPSTASVSGNVTLPSITCTTNTLTGSISGYVVPSTGLQIQLTGGSTSQTIDIASGSGATYTFGVALNTNYTMDIITQPYNQGMSCTFDSSAGTTLSITPTTSFTTESITCSPLPNATMPTISMSGILNTITMTQPDGDTICYRTDGGNAQCSATAGGSFYSIGGECASGSTKYDGNPFNINGTTAFNAVACSSLSSIDQSGTYTYTATINGSTATPTFSPAGATFNNDQTVSISSSTAGSVIYANVTGFAMTCDGTNSAYNGSPLSLSIPGTTTIYAIACAPGYTKSAQNSTTYTLRVADPVVSHNYAGNVTITGSTVGASYYYTTDGTTPVCGSSTLYTSGMAELTPLPSTNTPLQVIGCKTSYTNSAVVSHDVRFELRVRVTGLYSGPNSLPVRVQQIASSLDTTVNYGGTVVNDPKNAWFYPVITNTYDVGITLTQVSLRPGPRCYVEDPADPGYLFSTGYTAFSSSTDKIINIGCPVYVSSGNIPVTRCPASQTWDVVNGGCTGTFKTYKFCEDMSVFSDFCSDNTLLGSYPILPVSPLVYACNNVHVGTYSWTVPTPAISFSNILNEAYTFNSYGPLPIPSNDGSFSWWTGETYVGPVLDVSNAYKASKNGISYVKKDTTLPLLCVGY